MCPLSSFLSMNSVLLTHHYLPCARLSPAGIGYGLYLTLSSWTLYYVATHMDFFDGQIGMFSLQETEVRGGD